MGQTHMQVVRAEGGSPTPPFRLPQSTPEGISGFLTPPCVSIHIQSWEQLWVLLPFGFLSCPGRSPLGCWGNALQTLWGKRSFSHQVTGPALGLWHFSTPQQNDPTESRSMEAKSRPHHTRVPSFSIWPIFRFGVSGVDVEGCIPKPHLYVRPLIPLRPGVSVDACQACGFPWPLLEPKGLWQQHWSKKGVKSGRRLLEENFMRGIFKAAIFTGSGLGCWGDARGWSRSPPFNLRDSRGLNQWGQKAPPPLFIQTPNYT